MWVEIRKLIDILAVFSQMVFIVLCTTDKAPIWLRWWMGIAAAMIIVGNSGRLLQQRGDDDKKKAQVF